MSYVLFSFLFFISLFQVTVASYFQSCFCISKRSSFQGGGRWSSFCCGNGKNKHGNGKVFTLRFGLILRGKKRKKKVIGGRVRRQDSKETHEFH